MERKIKNLILAEGSDDYIMFPYVVDSIREVAQVNDWREVKSIALSVLRDLTTSGLVVFGELGKNGGFDPWSAPASEVLQDIDARWEKLRRDPTPWDMFPWLTLTDAGEARAKHAGNPL